MCSSRVVAATYVDVSGGKPVELLWTTGRRGLSLPMEYPAGVTTDRGSSTRSRTCNEGRLDDAEAPALGRADARDTRRAGAASRWMGIRAEARWRAVSRLRGPGRGAPLLPEPEGAGRCLPRDRRGPREGGARHGGARWRGGRDRPRHRRVQLLAPAAADRSARRRPRAAERRAGRALAVRLPVPGR